MKFLKKNTFFKLLKILLIVFILLVLFVVYANWKIPHDTKAYILDSVDDVPNNSVAIVLGTSQYIGSRENYYFTYRIQAAKELYDAGKLSVIIVSGDNKHVSYNEPRDMKKALVALNVPDSIIYLDYAGFRTLDSMVRMGKVFGQNKFIVISQQFHNERAIFIARHYGYEAYGYNANDLKLGRFSFKTKIREIFARVKVFVDITLGIGPKFLGDPIDINKHDSDALENNK